MSKNTDLYDAIADRQGKTCQNHDALVDIMKGFDRRLRRVEIVGILIVVGTAGSIFKGTILALLIKIAGG